MNSRLGFKNCIIKSVVWVAREILKVLGQYAVDNPTFPVNRRFFHLIVILEGCEAVLGECWSRNDKPPDIWDTHGISGNVSVNPPASSSSPYPGGLNPWVSNVSEHTSPHVMSERQSPDTTLDPRCQSGPSGRNSFDPNEVRFSKDYGADQQRLQISELHFYKFPSPTTFASWKIRFKTEVCTCSQFPTEAVLWIKEVEMVESVDDFKSQCSMRGIRTPDFEVLDARIASALNKIIQNTPSRKRSVWRKWKLTKKFEETDRSLDLRILLGHWSQRFCRELCRPIYSCSSQWWYSGIRFKMGRNSVINDEKIPSDDILEGLYKLRIRASEKLKTVLELYNMEIHQKKAGPDYHRLKTMVKRSIEQNLRMKNFEARNENVETSAVVKNHREKHSEQRSQGGCWQWKANVQCSEGDNCSFRHHMNKRAKSTQPNSSPRSCTQQNVKNASRTRSPRGKSPSGRMFRLPCKDYLKWNLHQSVLWNVASSRMLVLQVREWMQIWWKVLLCASPGWWTAQQKV